MPAFCHGAACAAGSPSLRVQPSLSSVLNPSSGGGVLPSWRAGEFNDVLLCQLQGHFPFSTVCKCLWIDWLPGFPVCFASLCWLGELAAPSSLGPSSVIFPGVLGGVLLSWGSVCEVFHTKLESRLSVSGRNSQTWPQPCRTSGCPLYSLLLE